MRTKAKDKTKIAIMSAVPNHENQLKWQECALEYKRYEYNLTDKDIVVDLGAYDGNFAEHMHTKFGCTVVCVEPTDSILRLQWQPWAVIINKAAATFEGVQKFGGLFYYTSLFEGSDKYGFRKLPCFDINTILTTPISLLKVNIEGAEYEVMNHIIDAGLAKNLNHIQIQFHEMPQFDHEKEWNNIAKKLSLTHQIDWRMPFCWESWKPK